MKVYNLALETGYKYFTFNNRIFATTIMSDEGFYDTGMFDDDL